MELQLVTFEQAKVLKELGFPQGECWYSYLENIDGEGFLMDKDSYTYSAPTLELVAKWLREKKEIWINSEYYPLGHGYCCLYQRYVKEPKSSKVLKSNYTTIKDDPRFGVYPTYEEALSAGIDKAIEILKEE